MSFKINIYIYLLSVPFFLSCWFGLVGNIGSKGMAGPDDLGSLLQPLWFSNHGTHFAVIITGAEDVVMAFSRSETEDRRQ